MTHYRECSHWMDDSVNGKLSTLVNSLKKSTFMCLLLTYQSHIYSMFTPTIKIVLIAFQENVKILASTSSVMVIIKDDVASDMALNGNTILTKEIK